MCASVCMHVCSIALIGVIAFVNKYFIIIIYNILYYNSTLNWVNFNMICLQGFLDSIVYYWEL